MTCLGTLLNKFTFRFIILLIIATSFGSCKTGDTIADHGIVQKRKYQKGYHVNVRTPFKFKKEKVNLTKNGELSYTDTEKIKVNLQPEKGELQYPNRTLSEIIPEDEISSFKIDDGRVESSFDENMEASTSSIPAIKSHSLFPGFSAASDTVKQPNANSKDPDYYTDYAAVKRTNTLALLSFIFAMASLFIFGLPFGVAAVVCGIIGISQIEKKPTVYKGRAFAIIGIVVGIIAVLVMLVYFSTP